MPADPSIFQQYLRPAKSVMDYQLENDQAAARKNALQLTTMELGEKTQATQRAQKVRNALEALGATATDEARINALKATATPEGFSQADALDKSIQERLKTKAVTSKDEAEAASKKLDASIKAHEFHVQQLGAIADPESAKSWAIAGLQSGVFTPEQFKVGFSNIPTDPAGFAEWKQRALQGGVSATEQLKQAQAKLIADNQNATSRANNRDTNQTHITTTGMTNATSRANNAATIAGENARQVNTLSEGKTQIVQTDNGPVLVNKATGTGKAVTGPDGAQLPGVTKPLNDSQSKALLFGTRAQEAHKVLEELATEGTQTSIPGSRAPIVGGTISALSSGNRQMLDQAKRDFMTAVLRRESGASISSGEFDTADKQYFPQIGDSPKVIAQKARNRDLAIKGILVEVPEKQRASITPAAPSRGGVPSDIDAILKKHGGK